MRIKFSRTGGAKKGETLMTTWNQFLHTNLPFVRSLNYAMQYMIFGRKKQVYNFLERERTKEKDKVSLISHSREFLSMKTTFSYFPRMFENPAPAVKTSCERNINFKKIENIMIYQLYTNASKNPMIIPRTSEKSKEFIKCRLDNF